MKDPSKTPVATFHCEKWGFFTPRRPAFIDIFPPGQNMVELILVTLLYVEKLRQSKDRSSGDFGGGGGGGGGGGDFGGGGGGD